MLIPSWLSSVSAHCFHFLSIPCSHLYSKVKWVKCRYLCQTPLSNKEKNQLKKVVYKIETKFGNGRGFRRLKVVHILSRETKHVCSWMNRDGFDTQSNEAHSQQNHRYFMNKCAGCRGELIKEDGLFPHFLAHVKMNLFYHRLHQFICLSTFTCRSLQCHCGFNEFMGEKNELKTIAKFG